ncbi:MAG: hypothetical protein ACLTVV_08380 [Ruminococcus sp.]
MTESEWIEIHLLHLLDPPEGEEKDISVAHTGLGMYAVHQRLRYLYGEEYGLTTQTRSREMVHA